MFYKSLQLRTIPISSPNEISIQFTEPMSNPGTLTVTSALSCTFYSVGSPTYDPATFMAKWTLASPIGGINGEDQVEIKLSGAKDVAHADGTLYNIPEQLLDADWANPAHTADSNGSAFPTGNLNSGNNGGNFIFRITVLAADFNRDNNVDGSDFNIWNANKFTTVSPTGSGFQRGDANGDDVVDGADFSVWNSHKFKDRTMWPTVPPICGQGMMSQNSGSGGSNSAASAISIAIDRLALRHHIYDNGQFNDGLSQSYWEQFADELMALLGG